MVKCHFQIFRFELFRARFGPLGLVTGRFAAPTMGHACWPNGLRPGDGTFPRLRVSEMCHPLRRRFSEAQLFLLGSVSMSWLRATNLTFAIVSCFFGTLRSSFI